MLTLALILLIGVAVDYLRLRRALVRPSAPPLPHGSHPPISVVRPVRGLDVGAEANLIALLEQDYPGELEILIVFDDRADPAWAPTERLIASRAWARPVRMLTAGAPPAGRTGKLNAMICGVEAARGDLIAFSDSDTRPAPHLVRTLVEELIAHPDAADSFAAALVGEPPRTAADAAYAILLNAWYGCSAAWWARRSGGLPFIMGQLMVWRRSAIERIGGLASADGQLVDDMYLGRRAASFGMTNLLAPQPLHIYTGGMTTAQFIHLFRRWLLFSRNGLPWRFTRANWIRGAAVWLAAGILALAFVHGALWTALVAWLVLAASSASQLALNRRFGGAPIPLRWAWVPLAVPLLGPFVLLPTLADRKVDWRGRDYAIDNGAHLEGETAEHRPASV